MDLNIALQYLTLAGVLLAVYKMFFKQEKRSELADKDQQSAVALLKEQLKSAQDMNMKLIEENKNHIHTLEEGIKENRTSIHGFAIEIGKLATVISERIPKK